MWVNKTDTSGEGGGVHILRPKVGSLEDGREKRRTKRERGTAKREEEEECNVWETEKSGKGGQAPCKCLKVGDRWDEPQGPLHRNHHLGD